MSKARSAGLLKNKTPAELHWETLNFRCPCGALACITVRLYAPVADLGVDTLAAIAVQHGGGVPVVDTENGKYVRMGESAACAAHKAVMEQQVAKHPSSWYAEFDRGPAAPRGHSAGVRSRG